MCRFKPNARQTRRPFSVEAASAPRLLPVAKTPARVPAEPAVKKGRGITAACHGGQPFAETVPPADVRQPADALYL